MADNDGRPTGIRYDDPMDRFDSIADIQRKMASQKAVKEQEYADLLRQATTRNNQITPTQGFALTALAALPLIAGKFLSGRTKGATALDAGAAGVGAIQGFNQQMEQNDELRREEALRRANNVAGDLNITRSQEAALPGMFIRNKLEEEQMKQRQTNELEAMREKDRLSRQPPDPVAQAAAIKALQTIRDQGVPDPELWAQLNQDQQMAANRYATVAGGAEKRDRDSQRFEAVSQLPDAEPLPGAGPLVDSDRKDIKEKRAAFIQLQEGAKTFTDGIKNNDPQKARTGYSMMAIAMGGPGMANAGAALGKTEVGRKLGGIPDVIEGGDLSATAFQRAIGIDPQRLIKETVNMWRNALDTEVKLNYKRDAFKAIPDPFAEAQGSPGQSGGDVDTGSPEYQALVNENVEKIKAARAAQRQGR